MRTTAHREDIKQRRIQKDYVKKLTRYICNDARRKFIADLKGMSKNFDETVEALSDYVCKYDGYGLDITDY